jgi:hypothetical protein
MGAAAGQATEHRDFEIGRLQIHEPAGGRSAGAVLVLRGAAAAVPVLPPDPFEVVHLEHEEGDDPEENLGARHGLQRIGAWPGVAMGRAAQPRLPAVLEERAWGGASWEGNCSAPSASAALERAAAPADAAGEEADQPDQRQNGCDDEEPFDDEADAEGDDGENRENDE